MVTISGSKRPRIDGDIPHISNLPIGFLADVSAYLSRPSRAIFAVSLSSKISWQKDNNIVGHSLSDVSKAIISSCEWDTLDFTNIEDSLAYKLTDDDIYSILIAIKANQTLKKLMLTNCTNIIGGGLSPLRSSTVLELLDLSLVDKYESPHNLHHTYNGHLQREKISHEAILPIVESILASDGCALKYTLFPESWRWLNIDMFVLFGRFARRYNERFYRYGLSCSKCEARLFQDTNARHWMNVQTLRHGNTCYDCLKPFCDDCFNEDGHVFLWECRVCQKAYCSDCNQVKPCATCADAVCSGCMPNACGVCEQDLCADCLFTCDCCGKHSCKDCHQVRLCSECHKTNCLDCFNGEDYDVDCCLCCEEDYCFQCQDEKCNDTDNEVCPGCKYMVKIRLQQKEIDELKEKLSKCKC